MSSVLIRWFKPILGIAFTLTFLWLLLQGLDIRAVGRALANLAIPFLILSIFFLSIGYSIRILRWWWMLRSLKPSLPLKACVWPFLTSIAVNNVMPFRAGDILRIVGFRRQLETPAIHVLGTLLLERMMDLLVLLAIFFIGFLGLSPGLFPESFVVGATWLAGICITAILALTILTPWSAHIIHFIAKHTFFSKMKFSKFIIDQGSQFIVALGLIRSPSRLFILMIFSVLTWIFEGLVFALVAVALNAATDPIGPWFALSTGTLATLIPSSPGYVGTFDYFAALGLAVYGVSSETSVAFALTVHFVLWTPLTASGLLYLAFQGKQFWNIRSQAST